MQRILIWTIMLLSSLLFAGAQADLAAIAEHFQSGAHTTGRGSSTGIPSLMVPSTLTAGVPFPKSLPSGYGLN